MNELLTSSVVTFEALMVLENQLIVSTKVNRKYDDKFGQDGAKIGDTISVRKPARWLGRRGWTMQPEAFVETSVQIKLDHPFGIDCVFQTSELLLQLDDFSNRVLGPQVSRLATMIDLFTTQLLGEGLAAAAGTPGTTPNTLLTYLQGQKLLAEASAPQDQERYMVVNTDMNITIVDALKSLFQAARQIENQYETGRMGTDTAGYQWYNSENIYVHTTGAQGGTPLVNGANQTGNTLVTDGWTAAAANRLAVGDRFQITDVYATNPASYQATKTLRTFVCTQVGASDGSGNMTITFEPPLVGPGTAAQTVDSLPADNAPLILVGAANTRTTQGLCFHRDVAALVSADLPIPNNADMAARAADDQVGISVAMVRDWNQTDRSFPTRTDVLIGGAITRQELGVVIQA